MENKAVPIGRQIKEDLRKRLAKMEIDEALPSEIKLAEIYGVSRTTIRLAIGELLNEGLLYRIKGSGTYKQAVGFSVPGTRILGFSAQLKKLYEDVRLADILVEATSLPSSKAHLLGVAVGSKCWKFSRLWLADGKPFAYGIAYFRKDLLPHFDEKKLHLSMLETLQEEYGQRIVSINNNIMAKFPDALLMQKLNVEANQPLLVCESTEANDKGEKLFVDTRYHNAANYVFNFLQLVYD